MWITITLQGCRLCLTTSFKYYLSWQTLGKAECKGRPNKGRGGILEAVKRGGGGKLLYGKEEGGRRGKRSGRVVVWGSAGETICGKYCWLRYFLRDVWVPQTHTATYTLGYCPGFPPTLLAIVRDPGDRPASGTPLRTVRRSGISRYASASISWSTLILTRSSYFSSERKPYFFTQTARNLYSFITHINREFVANLNLISFHKSLYSFQLLLAFGVRLTLD